MGRGLGLWFLSCDESLSGPCAGMVSLQRGILVVVHFRASLVSAGQAATAIAANVTKLPVAFICEVSPESPSEGAGAKIIL